MVYTACLTVSVHVSTSIHNTSNININKIVYNTTNNYHTNEVSRGAAVQQGRSAVLSFFPIFVKECSLSILEHDLIIYFTAFPQNPVLQLFAGTQYIVACIRSSFSPDPHS